MRKEHITLNLPKQPQTFLNLIQLPSNRKTEVRIRRTTKQCPIKKIIQMKLILQSYLPNDYFALKKFERELQIVM